MAPPAGTNPVPERCAVTRDVDRLRALSGSSVRALCRGSRWCAFGGIEAEPADGQVVLQPPPASLSAIIPPRSYLSPTGSDVCLPNSSSGPNLSSPPYRLLPALLMRTLQAHDKGASTHQLAVSKAENEHGRLGTWVRCLGEEERRPAIARGRREAHRSACSYDTECPAPC